MRLTIFGASGNTGSRLVRQALTAGHQVTAVVRGEHSLLDHPQLRLVVADVLNPAAITAAIQDADAVFDTIGARDRGPTSVCTDAALSISKAMESVGVQRLIITSNSAGIAGPGDDWSTRFVVKPLILRPLLRHSLADMAAAEQAVRDSSLDWTIVRAPQLTDNKAKNAYRSAIDRNVTFGFRITREDLATAMLDFAADPHTIRKHVNVAN
ncbi:NAD(P)-dependent oxidoreductase [Nocardia suismassiliense]|uniref:NAD(P)-dependent oxidoreductase n=1 Tax=Nocardia suismassiliense TaxID=2077092 RepID=UPI000D1EDDB2|nr:NAD(P)H-binding protein [Nocardia suismassiliense]